MLAENITVLGFDNIIGQKRPVQFLQTLLGNGTLPHALIFSGIPGIGKRTAAKLVAMALNCKISEAKATSCGQCPSCRQILSGNHPDIILIEPQGTYLRIAQIRELLGTLAMKPYSAEHRVVVIADAQAMNKEASNALLKMLEEPPPETTLILTVAEKADLLPTIVSRCRDLRFSPLSSEDIISLLGDADGIDTHFVHTAAAMSNGSLSKAKQLATASRREQRDWLIGAAGLQSPTRQGRRPIVSALAFAAQLAQKKEQMAELLDMLKTWVRDLCIWPYHPSAVINSDYSDILAQVRAGLDDRQLLAIWSAVEKAQKDIAAKANLRLTLDVMALSIAGYGRS